jgi:hypothetical protein
MKKSPVLLIVLLFFSINALSQIEGDVRSNDNKRISKAIVVAMDTASNIIDSVMTIENGFYKFTNLKPGKYLIVAKAKGYENKLYKNVIARENLVDPTEGIDLSSATRLQIVLNPEKTAKQ